MSSAIKRCSCRQVLDVHGDHLLGCGNGNLRIRCHNALGEGIFHTLNNNANCQMEQRCNGYSNSRPGDIYHLDFELGCPTYFDVTVKACPHWQLDRDRIAIRPIHIARWIRSRSDRDRLNPIRNSGRYLHVRYACSRNI